MIALLGLLVVLGSGLIGAIAGPVLAVPFAVGLLLAGVPGARASGLRWLAVAITLAGLSGLGAGIAGNRLAGWGSDPGVSPITADSDRAEQLWRESIRILRDFPMLGTGLGTFARIHPYYKSVDQSVNTAGNSLIQWVVEAGFAGATLLALAVIWGLSRIVRAWRRVGSADRRSQVG